MDKVTTAAVYRFRKCRSSYDGVALCVRWDSDNREQWSRDMGAGVGTSECEKSRFS